MNELHVEIDRLKLQNKDQQWKLVMAGAGTPLGGARRADFGVQATDTVNSVSYKLMNKIFRNCRIIFDRLKLKRN